MRVLANDPDGALSRTAMQDLSEDPALATAEPSPLEAGLTQAEIRAIDERHRDEFLHASLSSAGKDQADILIDAKGAQWKAQIALALSQRTTASTGWIAEKLNMGTAGNVRKILSDSKGSDRF